MKFDLAIVFCLFFNVFVFSQDSLLVLRADSILINPPAIDSLHSDSSDIKTLDSALINSLLSTDSLYADSSIAGALDSVPTNMLLQDTALTDTLKIKSGFYFFISTGMQFINFNRRSTFQDILDSIYVNLENKPIKDSNYYAYAMQKQNFQTNFTFPLIAGIMWQFNDKHSAGLGGGFLYDNESVIAVDKNYETYNYKYTLQAFPLFVEYRLLISSDLISITNGDYFSLFFRYYWMLPGTEIYSSWGKVKADFDPLGNGFGLFLGYRFVEWEGFNFWGEAGYSSIEVKSDSKNAMFNSWSLGGISVLIRISY